MNTIGDNIRRLRKLNKLNQVEFAKLIGVSQGSLSDIESGKSKPSVETITAIYEKFQCSLEWILFGNRIPVESDKQPDSSDYHFSNDMETQLLVSFRALNTENQLELLEIAHIKRRNQNKTAL